MRQANDQTGGAKSFLYRKSPHLPSNQSWFYLGFEEIQAKHSVVGPKDEEADKDDYIYNGQNDPAAVLNIYLFPDLTK